MSFSGPIFLTPCRPDRGGVDFLGLRQVNIDMMSGVRERSGPVDPAAFAMATGACDALFWNFI